jgi:hypothetical protein
MDADAHKRLVQQLCEEVWARGNADDLALREQLGAAVYAGAPSATEP